MTDIYSYEKKEKEQGLIKTDFGKRQKEQFIEQLNSGDVVNDLFAVKLKNPPRTYKKGTMFDFVATDKTGDIPVKFWGGDNKERVRRLYESFKIGDVIQIRKGNVELYNDQLQISVNETSGGVRRCSENEYLRNDFISTLDSSEIKRLYALLKQYMNAIQNTQLKALLDAFFSDKQFKEHYMQAPSAITHHHNYMGGNLQHCIGVLRLCDAICDMYPDINRDLVYTGAILHDVGKLQEYQTTTAINKTDIGNFIGHIVIGDRWIREKIDELRSQGSTFDERLETILCHMILSHHGRYEYGSPRLPKIVEAVVLSQADLMDSQVKNYLQRIEDQKQNTDDDWTFIWDSDSGRKKALYLGTIYQEENMVV